MVVAVWSVYPDTISSRWGQIENVVFLIPSFILGEYRRSLPLLDYYLLSHILWIDDLRVHHAGRLRKMSIKWKCLKFF